MWASIILKRKHTSIKYGRLSGQPTGDVSPGRLSITESPPVVGPIAMRRIAFLAFNTGAICKPDRAILVEKNLSLQV